MKQFKWVGLALLIAALVSPAPVWGAGLEYFGVEGFIESWAITNTLTVKFAEPVAHWDYRPDFRVNGLTTESNFDADCTVKDNFGKSVISCDFSGMTEEDNLLKLKFSTEGVSKLDDGFLFDVKYDVSLPVERVFAVIKLPEKGVLAAEPINMSYFPSIGKTMTDGRHIMVYWEKTNVSSDDPLQFSIAYTLPETVSSTLVIALAAIIVVIVIGVGVYIRQAHKPKMFTSVLNEDERAVVGLLSAHGGKAVQKVLVRETDFSKAKVSRLVKNLKGRGVVDVEAVSGRENRVVLKMKSE
ncbi:MAG: helix-turn-helix transcriptional regulator [Candidatus Aenigmatarchaeota archaeon]